jgi:hypothetical protein
MFHPKARQGAAAALAWIFFMWSQCADAQQAKTGGSPLDTLMSTRIWADVPEAKDFVRETRRPPDSLAYQPVTGTDPERPKLRNKEELQALQGELERAITHNDRKAHKGLGMKKSASAASPAVRRQ